MRGTNPLTEDPDDFVSTQAQARRFGEIIKGALCDDSFVAVEACSSSGDDNQFIKELHKATGVVTIGSDGTANVGGSYWFGGWWTADDGRSQINADGSVTTDDSDEGTGIWRPF